MEYILGIDIQAKSSLFGLYRAVNYYDLVYIVLPVQAHGVMLYVKLCSSMEV